MKRLMRWANSQGHWNQSGFGGLPTVQHDAAPLLQRWQVVAGGLALLLSRVSHSERDARFSASYRLYQGLRRRLRQGAVVDASTELLSDVMHEIAEVADSVTIRCLRVCFDASLQPGHPRVNLQHEACDSRWTSRLQSQPRPSNRAPLVPEWPDTAPIAFTEHRAIRLRSLNVHGGSRTRAL